MNIIMKNILPMVLAVLLSCGLPLAAIADNDELDLLPVSGYLLMDYDSGEILAAKNADARLAPASITKVMTAYVIYMALAKGDIAMSNKMVTSKNAYNKVGSKSFLQLQKPYAVEELLKGMVIQSGNDAAISLAEKVAGSENAFVILMNEQAKRLGMMKTNFVNVTGLPNDDHYTTAEDLAKLAQAMIRDFPEHYQLYSQKSYTLEKIQQENRNQLLRQQNLKTEAGDRIIIDGLKTGHTESAGYCLLASGKTDKMRLISVVLGAGSDAQRTSASMELLSYGFNKFNSVELFPANHFVREVRVWKGADKQVWVGTLDAVNAIVPLGQRDQLKTNLVLATEMEAPIRKGQSMGHIEVMNGDQQVAKVPLVAMNDVEEGGIVRNLTDRLLEKTLSVFY